MEHIQVGRRLASFVAIAVACCALLTLATHAAAADPTTTTAGTAAPVGATTPPLAVTGSPTPSGGAEVVVPGAPGNCFAGNACAWEDAFYTSSLGYWTANDTNFQNDTYGPCVDTYYLRYDWNDCISSIYNDLYTCNATWYTDSGYGGSGYRNNVNTGNPNLDSSWNDKFSSFKKCNY